MNVKCVVYIDVLVVVLDGEIAVLRVDELGGHGLLSGVP